VDTSLNLSNSSGTVLGGSEWISSLSRGTVAALEDGHALLRCSTNGAEVELENARIMQIDGLKLDELVACRVPLVMIGRIVRWIPVFIMTLYSFVMYINSVFLKAVSYNSIKR